MAVFRAVSVFLLLACPSLARADGDFDAAQRAAQARNPPGLTCTLSVDGGRTQFQQGEIIRLTLAFTSDQPGAYKLWHSVVSVPGPAELHVSPTEGTSDPNAEVPTQTASVYEGPGPPAPTPITNRPVSVGLEVNESLRFDRPGTYRLYATPSNVMDGQAKQNVFFVAGKTFTVATNIVQFQIVPADPVWAHTQAQTALIEVQPHYAGPMTVQHPWDVLTSLGTPDSARALLSLMAADKAPRSSEEKGYYFCRPGLIGYPDQGWLVGEMERGLTAPDYAVTQNFLNTLADLATWRRTPKVADDGRMLRAYWLRAADAVTAKTDAARPMTLHTLLEEAWLTQSLGDDYDVQRRLPRLTHRMALDFDRLPPLPQEYLLDGDWVNFRTPAVLPALQRLWKSAPVPANADIFRPSNATLNGLILRRLREFAPAEGRALTVSEIARPQPRADLAALGGLPDTTLPHLDATLAARLADRQDLDTTCQLIARYATAAILPQARAFYAQPQDGSTQTSLLAYFLRVKPDYGTAMLHQALLKQLGRGGIEDLILQIAPVHYDATLERYAVAELDNPDPGVVGDAADTLREYGSAATEEALWARLRRSDANPKLRAMVEQGVATALAYGHGWYAGTARLKQIRAACVSQYAQQQLDEALRELGSGSVHVGYELNSDQGHWTVGQYHAQGRAALFAKIAQFPRGTAFSWQDIGSGPEEDRLFAQVQQFAQAHGETLVRWHPKPFPFAKT